MAHDDGDAEQTQQLERPEGEPQAQPEAQNGDEQTALQQKHKSDNHEQLPMQRQSLQQQPSDPAIRVPEAQTLELDNPVEDEYARKLMDELERRIEQCETAVGIKSEVTEPAGYESSLVISLCRLQQQASAVLQGSLAELDGKYAELRVWLESEHVSAASLLLTLQAKRDLILQQEEQLLSTAAQLRSLQGLATYINPPDLSELEDYRRRMRALEAQGNALAVHLVTLEKEVTNLAATYNTTMNMLSSVIQEWHVAIEKIEARNTEALDSPGTPAVSGSA